MSNSYATTKIFQGSKNDWADFCKDVFLDIMSNGGTHAVDYLKPDHPQRADGTYELPIEYIKQVVPATPHLGANPNANAISNVNDNNQSLNNYKTNKNSNEIEEVIPNDDEIKEVVESNTIVNQKEKINFNNEKRVPEKVKPVPIIVPASVNTNANANANVTKNEIIEEETTLNISRRRNNNNRQENKEANQKRQK